VLPLPLSRLLLVFDYLLRYFYDPPACLFDQVQYNLFGRFSSTGKQDTKGEGQGYFVCREVEDNYQRHFAAQPGKGTQSVRFYQLTPPDHSLQETPKVDGLVSC
jgi:E3 ubiquitin-protein ligase UBR4